MYTWKHTDFGPKKRTALNSNTDRSSHDSPQLTFVLPLQLDSELQPKPKPQPQSQAWIVALLALSPSVRQVLSHFDADDGARAVQMYR